MGGDGGVYATQRRFTRGCEKDVDVDNSKKNVKEDQRLRSSTCTQSSQPLVEPIVICELGNLYNKDELIQALMNKSLLSTCSHIRGLKDVKNAIFTRNDNNNNDTNNANRYICPVTRVEFNGALPFVLIWSTGYVLSEKAIREIGIDSLQTEYGPFKESDIIKLIPRDDDLVQLKNDMKSRRESMNEKKRKRDKTDTTSDANNNTSKSIKKEERNENKDTKMSTLNSANVIAQAAINTVKKQEEKSAVFKNMFG